MDDIEGRQVVTFDIPDAFLQVNWLEDNNYYLKFERPMMKMIYEIDKNCDEYVLTYKQEYW